MSVPRKIQPGAAKTSGEGRSPFARFVLAALFGAVASFALSCRVFTGQFRYAPAPVMRPVALQIVRRR